MFPIKLNQDWSHLMQQYKEDHQDPRNQFCHSIGIPLIAGSLPIGATIIGLPVAVPMFAVGWGFQFVGHYFEGKKPSNRRLSLKWLFLPFCKGEVRWGLN